jgi:hypothetical protein
MVLRDFGIATLELALELPWSGVSPERRARFGRTRGAQPAPS